MKNEYRNKIQKEAIEALLAVNRASIDFAMRGGKTFIGLNLSKNFKKVLVSYPNKPVKESWLADSEKFNIDIQHVTFTTHVSLVKHDLTEYNCLILDEVDQVSLRGFEHIATLQPKCIYGLSGTMPTKGDKAYYIKRLCPIVYTKTLDETTGKTNKDYRIIIHLLEPSTIKNIPLSNGRSWSESDKIRFFERKYQEIKQFPMMLKLMQSISYSKTKYEYALALAKKMKRGLLFLETSKQCDESKFPTYHSKNPKSDENLEAFQEGIINILATISQLKAGITFPNLNEAILLHTYSSNNRSSQKIGRCLQLSEEGDIATLHLLVLKGTRDEVWAQSALEKFDKNKISYVKR
jgi:superfamily II DNA or RNA helicase